MFDLIFFAALLVLYGLLLWFAELPVDREEQGSRS